MARVYISFLGTNDYLECYYCRGAESLTAKPVRFVQEATVRDNCSDWGPGDRIIIFTTKDAEAKNWHNDGHTDKDGNILQRKGLLACLEELNLPVPIANQTIDEGYNEEQVWKIFQEVFKILKQGDEVVFDITHALRSIPVLAMVVLQYAKIMKKVKLGGIYYGAFEALGNITEVRRKPVQDRRPPIVDLTALNGLMDWSIATDRFLESGDVKSAGALAKAGVHSILKETRGKDEAAQIIKRLAGSLKQFNNMLATCRGPEITHASAGLKNWIDKCQHLELPSPFRPLFTLIQKRLDSFTGDSLKDGLAAVRWCAEYNLIQQGFTMLEEVLFSYVVSGTGNDPLNTNMREIASQALKIMSLKIVEQLDLWKAPAKDHPELTLKMINFVNQHRDLHKMAESLRQQRNDLNHAGFTENAAQLERADRFGKELKNLLTRAENILKNQH